MAFNALDLEFEDEDESKKKKSEAVHVDVDLEFQGENQKGKGVPARPVAQGTSGLPKAPTKIAELRKLDEARGPAPVATKSPTPAQPTTQVAGANALKEEIPYDHESAQVVQLREQVRKVEFEAEVKVAVAEFKTEILSELLGDMKLMEHQIGQLLARINAKHPDMKQEALMIKKILADFTAKKRK